MNPAEQAHMSKIIEKKQVKTILHSLLPLRHAYTHTLPRHITTRHY